MKFLLNNIQYAWILILLNFITLNYGRTTFPLYRRFERKNVKNTKICKNCHDLTYVVEYFETQNPPPIYGSNEVISNFLEHQIRKNGNKNREWPTEKHRTTTEKSTKLWHPTTSKHTTTTTKRTTTKMPTTTTKRTTTPRTTTTKRTTTPQTTTTKRTTTTTTTERDTTTEEQTTEPYISYSYEDFSVEQVTEKVNETNSGETIDPEFEIITNEDNDNENNYEEDNGDKDEEENTKDEDEYEYEENTEDNKEEEQTNDDDNYNDENYDETGEETTTETEVSSTTKKIFSFW